MPEIHVYIHGARTWDASVEETMHEFKHGTLHSGSKKGPEVKSRKQAIAIALNQAGKSKDEQKHDPKTGQFAPGAASGSSSAAEKKDVINKAKEDDDRRARQYSHHMSLARKARRQGAHSLAAIHEKHAEEFQPR